MAKTITRERLDKAELKKLYSKLKSVGAVAKEVGASYMGVRRNLLSQGITLVPQRNVAAQASATRTTSRTQPAEKTGKLAKDDLEVLSRAIAGAIFGEATVQLKAQTRQELWNNIHEGVETGMRQIGFRP